MTEEQMAHRDPPATADMEELLTLGEAVEFLGTSRPTMYRWLERGELKGLKAGKQWRFRKADLVAYMERGPVAMVAAPAEALEVETAFFGEQLESAGVAPATIEEEAEPGGEKLHLLICQMITLAVKSGASDLHLEPVRHASEAYLLLRIRIDGRLHEIRRMPIVLHEALTLHLKHTAGMEPGERRVPQGGRIHLPFQGRLYDLRVASLPTLFGEGFVMRILDRTASTVLGLEKLGLDAEDLEKFQGLLRRPNGLLLVAGPVGSGRSSLLYSGIQSIAAAEHRIYVLDEYIEHTLPYVTPVRLDKRAGLTMPSALRALMQNDPDAALVGEVPDIETAQLMQSMALTGHLVLAPVLTLTAANAVMRFIDLGVDPHVLGATLIGIVGVRLVRRICTTCKSSYVPSWSEPTLEHMRRLAAAGGYEAPENAPLFKGQGCDQCRNTGYKGRVGLYEVMRINPEISAAIMRGAAVETLTDLAVESGMRTLVADGVHKAVDGLTTVDEVRRVTAVLEPW